MKEVLEALGFIIFILGCGVALDFGCNDRGDRMTFIEYISGEKDPRNK